MNPLFTGLLFGIAGSLHCIGMCGPIVLAIPPGTSGRVQLIVRKIIYNFGRIITYSVIGVIFGLLGQNLNLFGFQQTASIIAGVIILVAIFIQYLIPGLSKKISFVPILVMRVQELLRKFLKKESIFASLLLGIVNGFLPCGFVYMAMAAALAYGSIINSSLFMAGFGLGTFPAMFLASILPTLLSVRKRISIQRYIPAFSVVLAILFILRGLNLGIPFLSPKMNSPQKKPVASPVMQNQPDSTRHKTEIDCCGGE